MALASSGETGNRTLNQVRDEWYHRTLIGPQPPRRGRSDPVSRPALVRLLHLVRECPWPMLMRYRNETHSLWVGT